MRFTEFSVTKEEKTRGIAVALVIVANTETLSLLRELNSLPGNEFVFSDRSPEDVPLVTAKTYDPGTVSLLVEMAEEAGNEFEWPRIIAAKEPAVARSSILIIGDPLPGLPAAIQDVLRRSGPTINPSQKSPRGIRRDHRALRSPSAFVR